MAARVAALNADLITLFNGDAIEGQHHKTTQIMSGNPNAQAAAWNEIIRVPLALKPKHIVMTRGTSAHVGESASGEERIADGLRRDKRPIVSDPETGAASLWHWYADLQGVRIDATHHGRIGQREHTRASGMALYAHDVHLSYTKRGELPPHLAFRGTTTSLPTVSTRANRASLGLVRGNSAPGMCTKLLQTPSPTSAGRLR